MDSAMEYGKQMTVEELISQYIQLFGDADELDDSSSLVQPHPFRYVPNITTNAVLVENYTSESTSAKLE